MSLNEGTDPLTPQFVPIERRMKLALRRIIPRLDKTL